MSSHTDEDRWAVNSHRGLKPHVLLELCELDAAAISRGCRFSQERRRVSAQRLRCIELRREHGLGLFDKLRNTP